MTFGGNQQIADEDGIAMHVATTQVQCPGNIVECRDDDGGRTVAFYLFLNLCNLVCTGNAGILDVVQEDKIFRQARTVFPNGVERIFDYG